MSDPRPEFRTLAFPRSPESAGGPTTPAPAMTPPTPAERHDAVSASRHHDHPGFVVEDRCEPEDDICDESYTAGDTAGEKSAIAGRIGTPDGTSETGGGEATPGELVEMILRLGQRLRGHLDGRFGTFGLSDARFAALVVIREAAPAGCTQAHLAAKLGQCESSISTLVERMRASHLLYRLRAKADRRKRVLMLTEDGRALLERGLACRDREARTMFSMMSHEEQRQLTRVLGRLSATLDRLAVENPGHEVERPAA